MDTKRIPIYLALGGLVAATLACNLMDIIFPKTLFVTKTADTADGECSVDDCSLREAVLASNDLDGHNEIVIPAGTYVLTIPGVENASDTAAGGDLDITDGADIHGVLWTTIIDGNASSRIFEIREGRRVEIRGLTIQNGDAYTGGGLANYGELTMIDSTVSNNNEHLRGGGIANGGQLTLGHVIVLGNTTDGNGGGIYNGWGGTITVHGNSVITGNTAAGFGGGIFNDFASQIEVQDSTVTQNFATNGGGISMLGEFDATVDYPEPGGILLTNTVVTSNSADFTGGGIYNGGGLKMIGVEIGSNTADYGGGIYSIWDDHGDIIEGDDVLVHDNTGGGIYGNGSVLLSHSAIINNSSGVILDQPRWGSFPDCALGTAKFVNITFSGNGPGSALAGSCEAEVTNVTIASNPGGGINRSTFDFNIQPLTLKNTILANNGGSNCSGAGGTYGSVVSSAGHNLDSGNTCAFTHPQDQINTDPLLDALQGVGSTFLHPLLAGSPAIDTGDNSGCPSDDQRNAPRPFGVACDIGAYEFGTANALPRLVLSPTVSPSPTAPLTFTPTPSHTLTQPPRPTWTDTLRPSPTFTKKPKPIVTDTPTTSIIIVTLGPIKPIATPTFTAIP